MPATINLENLGSAFKLTNKTASQNIDITALSNSFGFGGTNVSLIFTNINLIMRTKYINCFYHHHLGLVKLRYAKN